MRLSMTWCWVIYTVTIFVAPCSCLQHMMSLKRSPCDLCDQFITEDKSRRHSDTLLNSSSTLFLKEEKSSHAVISARQTEEDEPEITSLKSLSTSFYHDLGSYGVMFNIRALRSIMVAALAFHTDKTELVSYEVWTIAGSYKEAGIKLDAWTNISKGKVLGAGWSKPTDIFVEPVTIASQQEQAFYITLKTPDLRYAKGSKVDLVNASNLDVEIFEGAGVPQYPLGNTLYEPRVWNGVLYYSRTGKTEYPSYFPSSHPTVLPSSQPTVTPSILPSSQPTLSPTQSPSQWPSSIPSTSPTSAPTLSPTSSPTSSPTISLAGMFLKELTTTYENGGGGFGNMFDIKAKQAIVITGLYFHTDQTSEVYFEVWSKYNSYVGYEREKNAWTLVASGNVVGKGLHQGTPIPSDMWLSPIQIEEHLTQAFYVTLSTDDMRYSTGKNNVGSVVSSDFDIEILQGNGVWGFPFGEDFFEPRVWNGALQYYSTSAVKPAPVPSPPIQNTDVTFNFAISYLYDNDSSEVLSLFNSAVTETLQHLYGTQLSYLKEEQEVQLISVHSSFPNVTTIKNPCQHSDPDHICTFIDSIVTTGHIKSLSTDYFRYTLILHAEDALKQMYVPFLSQNEYIGPFATLSNTIITLNGKGLGEMDLDEQHLFEGVVKDFLKNAVLENVGIAEVVINSQQVHERSLQRNHPDYSGVSIELDATITGEYLPPPDVNFAKVVEDSFNENGDDFVENLKANQETTLFTRVTAVKVSTYNTVLQPPSSTLTVTQSSKGKRSLVPVITILVGLGSAFVLFVIWFCRRQKKDKFDDQVSVERLHEYERCSKIAIRGNGDSLAPSSVRSATPDGHPVRSATPNGHPVRSNSSFKKSYSSFRQQVY